MTQQKESWTAPKTLIALIALVVSILTNIYQYSSNEKKNRIIQEQWEISQEQWSYEKLELKNRLQEFEDRRQKRENRINELQDLIAQVDKDIAFCDQEIQRGQTGKYMYGQRILDRNLSNQEKIEASEKYDLAKSIIKQNILKKEELKEKKRELESERSRLLIF